MPLELERLAEIPQRWPTDAVADAFKVPVSDSGHRSLAALELTLLDDGTALRVTHDQEAWPEPAWAEGVKSRVLVRSPDGAFSHLDGVSKIYDHQGSRVLVRLSTYSQTVAILDLTTRAVEVVVKQKTEIYAARFAGDDVAVLTYKDLTLWTAHAGPHGRRWVPEAYRDLGGRKLAAAGEWLSLLDDDTWKFVRLENGRFMHASKWKLELPVGGSLTIPSGQDRLTWVGSTGSRAELVEHAYAMAPWPDAKSAMDTLEKHHKKMVKEAKKVFGFVPAPRDAAPEPVPLADAEWRLDDAGQVHRGDVAVEVPPITFHDAHEDQLGPEVVAGLRNHTWRHAFAASAAGDRAVVAHPNGHVYAVDLASGAARMLRWAPRFLQSQERDVQVGAFKGGVALLEDGRFAVAGWEAMVGGNLDDPLQTCLWNQYGCGASVGAHDGEIWLAYAFRGGSTFVSSRKKELNEAVVGRMDLSANDGITDERRVPLLFPQFGRGLVAFAAGGAYVLSER